MRKPIPATWFLASPAGFACAAQDRSVWAKLEKLLAEQVVKALCMNFQSLGGPIFGF